ncbi:pyrroline-5-carboxylate reductase [Corynebacterium aquilae]|uniref:Pyrroline-5-carboxylate reductase n=1 Tax=Corynebacterium aquilae DSM 44791 TaxID=1431546 RepID=A0A1L7CDL1_9CORY|nr:pyrroline-5-carboxylate reductase [Corynebacterium aquilae]APT83942.1 pyrroline-5-carboxylate reductase [Corynebacterium aquilae DSM 44791]
MTTVAIIGGGKIGEALLAGLVAGGVHPHDIRVANRRAERGRELSNRYGVKVFTDSAEAVWHADVVFLCVKPHHIVGVLEDIRDTIDSNDQETSVVSLAAGITLRAMEEALSAGTPIARVMPNTPMLVRKGVCALTPGRHLGAEQEAQIIKLLQMVGVVVPVAEKHLDAVTAVAGSSPAYMYLVVEAMIDSGIALGLDYATSRQLVEGSLAGAMAMLQETGQSPAELRANVSSPAGTTIAALRSLEESGVRGAFFRATDACAKRSREIGQQMQ